MNPGELLGLTPKQSQVLERAHAGEKDIAIGIELRMSVATVRAHMRMICARLGENSRGRAMVRWEQACTQLTTHLSQDDTPGRQRKLIAK